MKPTNFAKYLTNFLSVYLPTQKNASKNTIYSYRDTFKLLLHYCQDVKGLPVERLTLEGLSSKWITDFLEWLEVERKCSISTRNQRLAAIHAFFRYVQAEEPAGLFHFQKITSIPIKKAKKIKDIFSLGKTIFEIIISCYVVVLKWKKEGEI